MHTAVEFIRRARPAPDDAADSPGLTMLQKVVATNIVLDGGLSDGWCFTSEARLALFSSCSESGVRKAIAALIAKGWLTVKIDSVPRYRTHTKRHLRLTPIPADIMPAEEIEAAVDVARDETAHRKQVHRDRGRIPPRVCVRYEVADIRHEVADCHAPGSAEWRAEGARSDPSALPVHNDLDGLNRRAVASVVEYGPVMPSVMVLAGVPVPTPLTVDATPELAETITKILARWAPQLEEYGRGYALSLLATTHGLGKVEVACAVLAATNEHAANTQLDHVVTAITRVTRPSPERRKYVVRQLKRLGIRMDP